MGTSQVQSNATYAVPEWMKKQCLPRILTTKLPVLRTTELISYLDIG